MRRLQQLLGEVGARPVAAGLPVWAIEGPRLLDRRSSRAVEGARERLFHHALSLGASQVTYLQPEGGWTLHDAPRALVPGEFPDPWRTPPPELLDAMREHAVSLLISSCGDDIDWRIAVPGYSPPELDCTASLSLRRVVGSP